MVPVSYPDGWRHLTLVYEGAAKDSDRARASWVRIFVDGRECPIRILNDGLGLPEVKSYKPQFVHFRIGWDNNAGGSYQGRLDELSVWARALSAGEITGIFNKQALPYAVERQRRAQASEDETAWLRRAVIASSDPKLAEDLRRNRHPPCRVARARA